MSAGVCLRAGEASGRGVNMPAAAAADPATPPSAIPPSEALLGRTARPLQQRAVGKRSKKAPPLCLPLLALMAGISCWSFGRWLSSSPAPLTTPSTDKRACARWRQKPNHLVLAAGPTGSLEAARASRDAERRRRAAAAATSALKQAEDFLSRRGKSTIRLDATLRGLQDGRCIGGPELAPRFAAAHERLIQPARAQPSSSGAARQRSPAQRRGPGLSLHHEVVLQYIGSITLFCFPQQQQQQQQQQRTTDLESATAPDTSVSPLALTLRVFV